MESPLRFKLVSLSSKLSIQNLIYSVEVIPLRYSVNRFSLTLIITLL